MSNVNNGSLEATIELVKKTKNTSVKNLTVTYFD